MRKRIGFVFQHFNLIHRLSALENVMFGLVMAGMDRRQAKEQAIEALAKVGLTGDLDKRPGSLAAGSSSGWGSPGPWPSTRS